jgi:hypothetical protein
MASNYTPEQVVDGYQNGSSTSNPNLGPNGNVSLRQLNWHSDGFTAPASFLEFIEAVKVAEDGSYSFTNLGELLLSMQQGGDLTSLRTEILRELSDNSADNSATQALWVKIYELQLADYESGKPEIVEAFTVGQLATATYELFGGRMGTVPGVVDNESGSKFFPAQPIELTGKEIWTLNGVVQLRNAYDYITDTTSGINVGINFSAAPEENSVVEVFVAEANQIADAPFTKAIDANADLSSKTQAEFGEFESDYNSEITKNDAAKAGIEAKLLIIATSRDTALEAYDAAIAAINEATNAAAVKAAETDAIAAWSQYVLALGDLGANKFSLDKLVYLGDDAGVKYTDAISLKNSTAGDITNVNSGFQGIVDDLSAAKAFYETQTVVA